MEEEIQKDRNSEALKLGLILGLFSIIVVVLIYIIDVTILTDWKVNVSVLVISLGVISYMGRKFRDEEKGGFMSFKHSFLYSYVIFFVSSILSASFMVLLYEVIDPDVPKIMADASIENTEKLMRSFGAPEDKIDEAVEQLEVQMIESFSAKGVMKASWVYFLTSAFFSLITGLIIKKNEPDFE